MRILTIVSALLLTGASASAQPQRPFAPPRDNAPLATGTATIRGRVVAADTKRPLRRARVTVVPISVSVSTGRDGNTGGRGARSTITALDGTYVVKDLPAGTYRIIASRGGYLQLNYGQRRPGEQGRPVKLSDAQTQEKIDFALPRTSGIVGRITDELGEPIEGVSVYALRSLFFEGKRRLVPVSTQAITDEEGEYRLPRLEPGTYQVIASTRETWTAVENGKEVQLAYLPTYFPGVAAAGEGRRVAVTLGETTRAVDFSLVPGRTARISGIALDSQGRPLTTVTLSEEVRGLSSISIRSGPRVTLAADGTFSFVNVPPGEYTLQGSAPSSVVDAPEVATMTLVVDGSDIENVVLTSVRGGSISGSVVADEGPLPSRSTIVVTSGQPARGPREERIPLGEDGSFHLNQIFGAARVQVTVPEGWMVKSVRHEGRDITDRLLDMKSGQHLTGVEVVITRKVTELNGQVVDDKGSAVSDATVLVFPADAERWFENSRAMRAIRPDEQGRWQLKALPPGEYLAIAPDYVDDVEWQDPEYLESLRKQATRLTIPEGGTVTQSLKVVIPK